MLYDFLLLDRDSPVPLCQQLYEGLQKAILSGKLAAGDKLASIRQAAGELSISRTTVETAYDQLCLEGYAQSQPQSGYRVRAVLPHRISAPAPAAFRPKFDFSTSSIHPEGADLTTWKKLVRAILTDSEAVTSYGNHQGELVLRQELSSYGFRARGVAAQPENIFIGAGTGPLLQLLCPLLEDKFPVYMECPGFSQAEQIFKDYGFPVIVPQPSEGLCFPPTLPEAPAIAAELPSLRPRTGSAAISARRKELLEWVSRQENRYVLEDDYNGELHYRSRPLPAFQGICPERTIYLGSFSKLLVPSVRIAYMVLPPKLAQTARSRLSTLNQTAGKTEQLALAEYIHSGLLEKHLRRLRRLYSRKSQMMASSLTKVFGSRLTFALQETSLAFSLTFSAGLSGEELVQLAKEAGIACRHFPEETGNNIHIILGFSGIPEKDIPAGIDALGKVWKPYLK